MAPNDLAQLNAAAARLLEVSQVDVLASGAAFHDLASIANDLSTGRDRSNANQSLASAVPQRRLIFLDETVDVCVILRSPLVAESQFKHFLSRLEITLDTYAIGTPRPGSDRQDEQPAPVKDLIDTKIIEDSDPEIAVSSDGVIEGDEDDDDNSGDKVTFVLWKTQVHITRSRIRSYGPSVYFSVALRLGRQENDDVKSSEEEYMLSGVPASINLLDAFKSDPAFATQAPNLTLARLSKMTPSSGIGVESTRPLRNPQRRLIRLVPALNTRIQLNQLGVSPTQARVLAILDVETSSFASGELTLSELVLALSDGRAEPLGNPESMKLPLICKPSDILGYVYDLIPHNTHMSTGARERAVHSISLRLVATLNYQDPALPDTPPQSIPMRIQWRTPVDLTALVQRQSYIPPLTTTSDHVQSIAPDGHFANHLITLTVSGPEQVKVHDTLKWNLLIANRSQTRTLRLALIPITSSAAGVTAAASDKHTTSTASQAASTTAAPNPAGPASSESLAPPAPSIARASSPTSFKKGHRAKPTLDASFFNSLTAGGSDGIRPGSSGGGGDDAPAAQPEHRTPASRSVVLPADRAGDPGLLPITPDVRVGPLLPGASAEAQMRFAVLKGGVLRVEGIRVVDLDVEKRRSEDPVEARAGERSWIDVEGSLLPDVVAVW